MTNLNIFKKEKKFLMLAMDHRASFKKLINSDSPESATKEEIVGMKKKIIEAVADQMSGVLIDPFYGYEAYEKAKKAKEIPYLLCIERSGYETTEDGPKTEIQYKAEQLRILGASGIKLLLPFHPQKKTAEHQLAVAQRILDDAHRNDLPLFLEIVLEPKGTDPNLIIEAFELFLKKEIKPDVFKLDFPRSAELCQKITKTLQGIPWILLTHGVDFEVFKQELKVSMANGPSGFLAGRTLWQEIGGLVGDEEQNFLTKILPQRFEEISKIAIS
jgi:tagatose-1,6-bisphosphate aldolase